MGNACTSSTKKQEKDVLSQSQFSISNQVNIDIVPKELIQLPLKRVENDPDDNIFPSPGISMISENEKKRKDKRAKKVLGNQEEQIVYEKFNRTNKKLNENDIFMIMKYLKTHFVFYDLSESELSNIVSKMFYCEVKANEYVFKQGDDASSYFIVNEGEVEIIINEAVKRNLKKGEGFGDFALLYSAPRSASVKTVTNCGFWAIDRITFKKSVEEMIRNQIAENRSFMNNVKFFQNLTDQQKNAIANVISSQKFKKGDVIVAENDPASSFYVIKEGTVSVIKGDKELRKMSKGDSFGEQALYYKTTRYCTVKAETEVKCFALGREETIRILGDQVQMITFKNVIRWAFDKSPKLKKLTHLQIEKVLESMSIKSIKKYEIIFKTGDPIDKLIIPIDGNLIQKSKEIITPKGLFFGEECFSERQKNQILAFDIMMDCDGVVAYIDFDIFFEKIGGSWEVAIKNSEKSHEKTIISKAFDGPQEFKDGKVPDIKLNELIAIKKLGFGQFGSVYLVRNKADQTLYAIKSISKAQILEQNLERHLAQEKSVLQLVNFPFIMKFLRSFKDSNSIYFLEEYVKGMELFDVIREIGLLSSYDSQYFAGSLILALEYLHSLSVIYRDIKPENIMIDEFGCMKLIDMGTAKMIGGKQQDRTFTIIGTPHYMAPEIITGKGYSYSVDIWSIGICLYEFLCGGVPFAEDADDPYEIYEEIIKKPCSFPNFMKDKKAKKIIDQMLSKIPEARLGGSYASLKSHIWYQNFDWDKLYSKELKPPFIPPKAKMLNNKEINKLESQNKLFIDVIKNDTKASKKVPVAKDPNWDKNY